MNQGFLGEFCKMVCLSSWCVVLFDMHSFKFDRFFCDNFCTVRLRALTSNVIAPCVSSPRRAVTCSSSISSRLAASIRPSRGFPQEPDNVRYSGDTLYICNDGRTPNGVFGYDTVGYFRLFRFHGNRLRYRGRSR